MVMSLAAVQYISQVGYCNGYSIKFEFNDIIISLCAKNDSERKRLISLGCFVLH